MLQEKTARSASLAAKTPFYYGWINLAIASLAMLATLPGRSVGLALITEPMLGDLQLSRLDYGAYTFFATLIGAAFNPIVGPLIDRWGSKLILSAILLGLGAVVVAMSQVASAGFVLLALLLLVRGLGQSALSVASLTLIGKWFVQRLSKAMGIFSVIIGIGFATLIVLLGQAVETAGWRVAWMNIGLVLLGLAVLAAMATASTPEKAGLGEHPELGPAKGPEETHAVAGKSFTLREALSTMAFWVFGLASAFYGFTIAGVTLFSESILLEKGFGKEIFQYGMGGFLFLGLAGNLLAGWLAQKRSLGMLMGIAMVAMALALGTLPLVGSPGGAIGVLMLLGFAGGVVTVIFFTAWGKMFGRTHLGKIQGFAQVLSVLASASGPWFLARVFAESGSYDPAFWMLAPVMIILAVLAFVVKMPGAGTPSPR